MASSRELLTFLNLLVAAVALVPARAQEYCGDSLAGLMECRSFMFCGASAPSPACCAAYEAAFDADPFCLCYVADGTFGRATGYDVNVSDAFRIPACCGQADPPIALCSMQELVLPPYAPRPPGASPMGQPSSGSSEAPLPFISPPPPPLVPISKASDDDSASLILLWVGVAFLLWSTL